MSIIPFPGKNIKIGTSNNKDDVSLVQSQLISKKFVTPTSIVIGTYDIVTENVVKEYQKKNYEIKNNAVSKTKLAVDGIVGIKTWTSLFFGVTQPMEELLRGVKSYKTLDSTTIVTKIVTKSNTISNNNTEKYIGNNTTPIERILKNLGELDSTSISKADSSSTPFQSYIINLATNTWMPLPVIPESVGESVGANWNDISIPGRSASYRSYQGTRNRTLSFSITLHSDMLAEMSYGQNYNLVDICDYIKSLTYPEYSSSALKPPVCILKIADMFKLRGTCDSVSISYKLPLKKLVNYKYHNKDNQLIYSVAEVSFQFTEVPITAPKASDIAIGKTYVTK